MTRKVIVPKPISREMGKFGLLRQTINRLLTLIHAEIAGDYPKFRQYRASSDETMCRCGKIIQDAQGRHLFTFTIDDTTSPNHLIITDLRHNLG